MLNRILPVLFLISLICYPVIADINGTTTTNETTIPNYILSNYSPIKPGENITILFQISMDKAQTLIDIPVPEIYTYNYSNNNYYYLPTEERTYKYLTCNIYDNVNITAETISVPVNITVIENASILRVNYIFAPPKSEYNNSTVFFIQNIEDISYITKSDGGIQGWTWLILIIPLVVAIAFFPLIELSEVLSTRRRRSIEALREHRRNIERLRLLRQGLDDYPHSLSHTSPELTPTPRPPPPPPPTIFKCKDNKKDELREFVEGDGLFEKGIKKFKVPPFDEQIKMINNLPEVENFNLTALELVVNLDKFGKYFLKLRHSPTVYRIENNETMSYRNPYIHNENFGLCLGSGTTLYNRCFKNKNYVECVRILCEVLKSEHGSGYRKWSDCRV